MVGTIKPTGAISEFIIAFLVKTPRQFLIVDKDSNQWGITESTFNDLAKKGYPIKEVRKK